MTAIDTLRRLAAGEQPRSGLLHTTRLEAFGTEHYGEEAIVEAFRLHPQPLTDKAVVVTDPGHLAIFDGSTALVADLHGELIGRIWRLGEGEPCRGEPRISVAFDPDLAQARGDVFAVASDHPALEPTAFDRVLEAGRDIARDDPAAYRTRAFALRAFGSAVDGAALFAVHRLAGQPVRTSGFALAAAHWTSEGSVIVRDRCGEAALRAAVWSPSITL